MKENPSIDIERLEGRYYIIGRDSHISIHSPLVSQHHAKISITNGRIHLSDLNSTNGTYLIRDDRIDYFDKYPIPSSSPFTVNGYICPSSN